MSLAPFLGPTARIITRYISGALTGTAVIHPDPDVVHIVQLLLGIGIGAATEAFYWAARRFGWNK